MTKRKAFLAVAAALYLVSTTAPAVADPVKNIVLVHGAWVDASGWKPVFDILIKEGFNVTMVQEPETSFQEDVTATKRILDLQDGPTLLVGHSYGGSIITEAGIHPNVVGLVYVAAHAKASACSRAPGQLLSFSVSAWSVVCVQIPVPDAIWNLPATYA
jgi:pimeloyl-ACP methyl ester carboxylesterase